MPLLELKILEIHSFPHFSLTRFDILSWNFAYDFDLLYYRSSLSVVNLCQFLLELCPFWNLEYWKYSFPHFSLTRFDVFPHFCSTWFDILSWNFSYDCLMYYRSISSVITLCPSGSPSVHPFSALFSYMHWQISLKFKIWHCFLQSFNVFLLEKYYIKIAF